MPSRLTPNKAEKEWLLRVVESGCIVCRNYNGSKTPAEAHHIAGRSAPNGHWLLLPLCPGHHRAGKGEGLFISRHPFKARFEAEYGTEQELFNQLCNDINGGLKPWEKQ